MRKKRQPARGGDHYGLRVEIHLTPLSRIVMVHVLETGHTEAQRLVFSDTCTLPLTELWCREISQTVQEVLERGLAERWGVSHELLGDGSDGWLRT